MMDQEDEHEPEVAGVTPIDVENEE